MARVLITEGYVALSEIATPATPVTGEVKAFAPTQTIPTWAVLDDAGVLGKIAWNGAFTLTVPATGTAALLGAQTFTARQTVDADDAIGILVADRDRGSNGAPSLFCGRNTNGSTPSPGYIRFREADGGDQSVYPDDSGVLRIQNGIITNANYASGTVVGTQTSMAEAKLISDDLSELGTVMARIRRGAAAVRRFRYRSGAFGGEMFEGVVTDYAPAYGMDRDADHPQGKALNEIVIAGDFLRFAAWAMAQIDELSQRVAALEKA